MVHKIFFLIVLSSSLFCQKFPDPSVDKVFREGITLALSGNYEEARNMLNNPLFRNSVYPFFEILSAASEIGFAYDYSLPTNTQQINDYLDIAEKKLKEAPNDKTQEIWLTYCEGLISGYRAILHAYNAEWLAFVDDGLESVGLYERCLEIDPNFGDAYATIGAFKFWRSEKLAFLNWLPFVSDEREEGRKMLEKAKEFPSYHSYFIYKNLFDIYFLNKDFQKAESTLNEAVSKYPKSRMFQYDLARFLGREKAEEAIQVLWRILKSYDKNLQKNRINEIRIKGRIVNLYFKAGQVEKAKILADEILAITNFSKYEESKLEKTLDRVDEIREEIE